MSYRQLDQSLKQRLSLDEADIVRERLASGGTRFDKNLRFAVNHLKGAGLLVSPKRGEHEITSGGRDFLATLDRDITFKWLAEMKVQIQQQQEDMDDANGTVATSVNTEVDETLLEDELPDDLIVTGMQRAKELLLDEMQDALHSVDPYRFEQLVIDLLEKMGYGEGRQVGRSGDGGIDGIINQDPLGLEKVYIQAKRWQNQVGEPEIRNFSGSLDTKGAIKGVFITTSNFSSTAIQSAETISAGPKLIRLIDGQELARLMIDHNVGVVPETTYVIKKLDENYFSDEI